MAKRETILQCPEHRVPLFRLDEVPTGREGVNENRLVPLTERVERTCPECGAGLVRGAG